MTFSTLKFIVMHRMITYIIIRWKCFFLFIGQEPSTWPANNWLQIMVCSCAMLFNCFWLQILFLLMRKWNHTCYLLFYVISVITSGKQCALTTFRRYYLVKKQSQWWNDKTITELGYRKILWFASVLQIKSLTNHNILLNLVQ